MHVFKYYLYTASVWLTSWFSALITAKQQLQENILGLLNHSKCRDVNWLHLAIQHHLATVAVMAEQSGRMSEIKNVG